VQPASLDIGLELTPLIAARLDEMVDMVAGELAATGCRQERRRQTRSAAGRRCAPRRAGR
jgi:hypothetical protein